MSLVFTSYFRVEFVKSQIILPTSGNTVSLVNSDLNKHCIGLSNFILYIYIIYIFRCLEKFIPSMLTQYAILFTFLVNLFLQSKIKLRMS